MAGVEGTGRIITTSKRILSRAEAKKGHLISAAAGAEARLPDQITALARISVHFDSHEDGLMQTVFRPTDEPGMIVVHIGRITPFVLLIKIIL